MATYFDTMIGLTDAMRDGPIKTTVRKVLDLHVEFENEAAKTAGNADLSADGKRKAARAFAAKQAYRFVSVETFVERGNARIAEKRSKFSLPAIDKTDAVAAAMAVECARRVFGMSRAEKKAVLANASLPYLQAVLAAPDELTGIDSDLRQVATTRALDLAHPGKLAELEQDQESLRLLAGAVRAAREVARNLVGLPNEAALSDFINTAVPDQRHIAADVERETASLAA